MKRSKVIDFSRRFVVPVVVALVTWLIDPLIELKDYYKNDTQIILIVQGALTIIVLAAITYIGIMYSEIQENTEDISNSLDSSVELLKYGDRQKYSTPFDLPIELIKNAKSEILILDYFPWQGSSTSDPKISDIDTRYELYYEELIKAATKSDPVEYHRLIQLPAGPDTPSAILKLLLKINFVKNHFEKMIDLMKIGDLKTRVSIKTCTTTYPNTTFIIIDGKHVIWEVPYLIDGEFKFDLDLYIVDSQGTLAQELKSRFVKLSDNAKPLSF